MIGRVKEKNSKKYYGIIYWTRCGSPSPLYCYKYNNRFYVINGGWDFDANKPYIDAIDYKPNWEIVLDDMDDTDYNTACAAICLIAACKAVKKLNNKRPLNNITFE